MINSKMIFRILGFLLLIETVMLLCCGGVSLFYKENDLQSFLVSSAITTSIGILLLAIGKDAVKSLNRRDGYVIVSVAWVTFSLFGMLPYYIGGYIPSVTDAFFETMSGFSSTGATILNNIESMPHGILFWRAMTQWIGGWKRKIFSSDRLLHITFLICMVIPCGLSIYYSFYSDYQPQGRYLMPMLIPLLYFVTTGLTLVLEKIPQKVNRMLYGGIYMFFILISAASFYYVHALI